MTDYRSSLAVGGSDASSMVKDYEAWAFRRKLMIENKLPSWLQNEETDAMRFGTLAHMAILEPERYRQNVFVCPEGTNFTTKAGKELKAAYEKLKESKPDLHLIKLEQAWAIERIMEHRHEVWEQLAEGKHEFEKQFFHSWWDGFAIKGTCDLLTSRQLVDIKTTRNIHNVEQSIADYRYNVQLAHYNLWAKRPEVAIVFIENVPPYRVRWVDISEEQMEAGLEAHEIALKRAAYDGLLVREV